MGKNDVLKLVDPNYVLSITQQLVRIPTESPGQNERSKDRAPLVRFLNEQFKPLSLKTKSLTIVEGRPNIYVEITGGAGEGPTLLFCASCDTIEVTEAHMEMWSTDPFGGEIREGKLYGVGSADDKSSATGVIGAVRAIVESGIKFNGKIIALFAVAGESAAQGGTKDLVKQNLLPKADGAILACNSDQKMIRTFKGRMWIEFSVNGKSVHACMPETGINAIQKAIKVVQALERTRFTEQDDPVLGKVTLTPTTFEAVSVPSAVPSKCRLIYDMRMIPGLASEKALRKMQGVLDSLMREDKELNVLMKVTPNSIKEACETPLEHPVVQATAKAMERVMGQVSYAPGIMSGAGFTFFKYGIPAVHFGPGSISNAHKPNEYVEVERLEEAAKIYALAALNFLGVPD